MARDIPATLPTLATTLPSAGTTALSGLFGTFTPFAVMFGIGHQAGSQRWGRPPWVTPETGIPTDLRR